MTVFFVPYAVESPSGFRVYRAFFQHVRGVIVHPVRADAGDLFPAAKHVDFFCFVGGGFHREPHFFGFFIRILCDSVDHIIYTRIFLSGLPWIGSLKEKAGSQPRPQQQPHGVDLDPALADDPAQRLALRARDGKGRREKPDPRERHTILGIRMHRGEMHYEP